MSLESEIEHLIKELGTEVSFSKLFGRVTEKFPDAQKKQCKEIVGQLMEHRDHSPTRSGSNWKLDSSKQPFYEVNHQLTAARKEPESGYQPFQ